MPSWSVLGRLADLSDVVLWTPAQLQIIQIITHQPPWLTAVLTTAHHVKTKNV